MSDQKITTYTYPDENGNEFHLKDRLEPGSNGKKKTFRFRHLVNGKWNYSRRDEKKLLYNLPELIKAKYAFIVEGENKVECLKKLGYPATCLDSGASSPWIEEYNEPFRNKQKVVILPDNDEAGRRYAQTVAHGLKAVVPTIQIVELPNLPEKGDVVDWMAQRDSKSKKEIKEELTSLIKNTPKWEAPIVTVSTPLPIPPKVWPSFEKSCHEGLAGEFVKTIEPHSESDPRALLIQFLVAFGSVVGRSPYIRTEADKQHVNIFAVLVGETSRGRKGTSWGYVNRLFSEVDPDWTGSCVKSGLSSGEGLIYQVRDPLCKYEDGKEIIADSGVEDKRLLVKEAEFSSVLRMIRRDGNILSTVIRDSWDSGTLRNLTKKDPNQATDAHISIIGHITRDELIRELTTTDCANGFANRFLWLCSRRSKRLPEGGNLSDLDFEILINKVKEAVRFARGVQELTKDESARDYWAEIYDVLSEDLMGMLGAIISRAEPQVLRLASIYALLDKSSTIKRKHLEAALALWNYSAGSAKYIFGDTLGDEIADQVFKALKAAPNGLSRTQISELFSRHKEKNQINRALGVLYEKELVHCEQVKTEGRTAEVWLTGKAKKAK